MPTSIVTHQTVESFEIIQRQGFTGFPYGDRYRVAQYQYVLLTQNARKAREMLGEWGFAAADPAPHRAAFALGRIAAVVPHDGHLKLNLREIARLPQVLPNAFPKQRGMLSYKHTLEALGIDPSALDWEPVGSQPPAPPTPAATASALCPAMPSVEQALAALVAHGYEVTLRAAPLAASALERGRDTQ